MSAATGDVTVAAKGHVWTLHFGFLAQETIEEQPDQPLAWFPWVKERLPVLALPDLSGFSDEAEIKAAIAEHERAALPDLVNLPNRVLKELLGLALMEHHPDAIAAATREIIDTGTLNAAKAIIQTVMRALQGEAGQAGAADPLPVAATPNRRTRRANKTG